MQFLKKLHDTNSSIYENCIKYIAIFKKNCTFLLAILKKSPL